MKIRNHRLFKEDGKQVPFVTSPNIGGVIQPRFLIIHYTAASSAAGTISWFQNRTSKVSAHLVIARDGSITQMVAFNRLAQHAGDSRWGSLTGLNLYSIGIELDNAGKLIQSGGKWISPATRKSYPENEVTIANHKHDPAGTPPSGWHAYTEEQINAVQDAGMALIKQYGLKDVLGHEDIAPSRKSDPGPDFPMASLRARLFGRANDQAAHYRTTAELNIRSGAGTEFPTISGSPLPAGTEVEVLARNGVWWQVDVMGSVNGVMDIVGWCHSRLLAPVNV